MNFSAPHRRFNPLTREWVLVSPHRAERPWLGQVEKVRAETPPAYAPDCYLCPGNKRSGGAVNPHYTGTFVFDNDFPALLQGETSGYERTASFGCFHYNNAERKAADYAVSRWEIAGRGRNAGQKFSQQGPGPGYLLPEIGVYRRIIDIQPAA